MREAEAEAGTRAGTAADRAAPEPVRGKAPVWLRPAPGGVEDCEEGAGGAGDTLRRRPIMGSFVPFLAAAEGGAVR